MTGFTVVCLIMAVLGPLYVAPVKAFAPCMQVYCFVNPCDARDTPCPANTKCVPDYCGGCNSKCVPCKRVNCFINPCAYKKCPRNTKCVPNYCGGCNADCVAK